MNLAACLLALLTANEAIDARDRARDAQLSCDMALSNLDGVNSVGLAGSGADYRLLVAVRDLQVKLAARARLGGDVYQGVRVLWSVASSAPATAWTPPPPPPVAKPPSKPAPVYAPPPAPVAAPVFVETRRTFWAGPARLTPPPRPAYYGGGYGGSNCHPSRAVLSPVTQTRGGRPVPYTYATTSVTYPAPRPCPSRTSAAPAVCYRPGR